MDVQKRKNKGEERISYHIKKLFLERFLKELCVMFFIERLRNRGFAGLGFSQETHNGNLKNRKS